MKTINSLLICLCIVQAACSQVNRLPAPSGNYPTGVDYLSFTDSNRKELFDNSGNTFRELTVKVWYPAAGKAKNEPYLENPDLVIRDFQFPENYRNLSTNSSRGVPVSQQEKAFPVLIFSHGWGEHFSQNTILMEELASHGYIIFSIAHHFECKFSFYPDGRYLALDPNSERFGRLIREQQNPEAMAVFGKMATAKTDEERLSVFIESNNLMPVLLKESPEYWAGDIGYLVDQLGSLNDTSHLFRGKLDLSRIGVLGMSMGGIATGEICLKDDRIRAGINIDGGLNGSLANEVLDCPFLFINSQRYLGYGNLFAGKSLNDCYSIGTAGADHYNFTDYALYPVPSVSRLIGPIDPEKPVEIMNLFILAFFDKYLKGNDLDLISLSKKYTLDFDSKIPGRLVPGPVPKDSNRDNLIRQFIDNELKNYPEAHLQDLYKNYFQDAFGPGHLIPDTAAAAVYLDWELEQTDYADTVLIQPLGINHDYYRINLVLVKNGVIPRDTLLMGMVGSAPLARKPDLDNWKKEWAEVAGIIRKTTPGLPGLEQDEKLIARMLDQGEIVIHHSEQYQEAYHPHYRIIHRSVLAGWKKSYLINYL